jgi:hypothetical protein
MLARRFAWTETTGSSIRYVAETRTQHALYMVVNKLGGGS